MLYSLHCDCICTHLSHTALSHHPPYRTNSLFLSNCSINNYKVPNSQPNSSEVEGHITDLILYPLQLHREECNLEIQNLGNTLIYLKTAFLN